ncbi:TetR/AcrR family transcriptional regulator C-terminal domain-containing protein [Nonomuraea sp. NPDC052129]|uniref:TetR/AcrR family transcriptional regulator C-terminal domain-containing protein n=1 Tax=Nonomuraea sp. NPDC052129 TaxID=3154651 RepID=UPI003439DC0B
MALVHVPQSHWASAATMARGAMFQTADRVCGQAYDPGTAALTALPPGATWQDEIQAQAGALRHVILRHPSGAILLADSPQMLSPGALSLMERLLSTLEEAGVPAGPRIVAAG